MRKRVVGMLASAAFASVAFAALPAVASAGEYEMHCEGAAVCTGTVQSTGHAVLTDTNNLGMTCTSVTGSVSQNTTTKTGTAQLEFANCTDTTFHTKCFNTGLQAEGKITTNVMTSHLVYIEPNATTPGVRLSGINVTYNCPSVFIKKTLTGSVLGHVENPSCGTAVNNHTLVFQQASNGHQKFKQVTTAGPTFDLMANNHAGGAYSTAGWTGTWHINYNKPEKTTC